MSQLLALPQDAQARMDMSSTSLPESRRHGVNGANRELPLTDGQRIDEKRGNAGDDRHGGDDGRPGTTSRFGKWAEVAMADDSVSDAARRSLQATLAAVQHYLPLAANQASQDIEYVHQLRVFTRRSMAVIEIFGERLPKQHAKWLNRKLRQIRRAAGTARDLDVLELRYARNHGKHARSFLISVHKQRAKAQRPIIKISKRLHRNNSFARHLEDLWDATGRKAAEVSHVRFGDWARVRMRRTLEKFFKAVPRDVGDLDALHRFRIRGKELRYAMEILSAAFPARFRDELYPVVKQLQEMLGEINDHVIACRRIRKWMKAQRKKGDVAHLRKMLDKERRTLNKSRRKFERWWTPAQMASLQASLEQESKSENAKETCNAIQAERPAEWTRPGGYWMT